jgi:hypothetical protein
MVDGISGCRPVQEGDWKGEVDVVVGIEVVICWTNFCSESCWECRRRYFCRAKARLGSFRVGFV